MARVRAKTEVPVAAPMADRSSGRARTSRESAVSTKVPSATRDSAVSAPAISSSTSGKRMRAT